MKKNLDSNLSVFTTGKVINENKLIKYVVHDSDGEWQFLTGEDVNISDLMIVQLNSLINIDPSIQSIFDLPRGFEAMRNDITDEWKKYSVG